jgi:hypothetical protein
MTIPPKRESRPAGAALPNTSRATERPKHNHDRKKSLYRARPGCALLVKRTLLRCGGRVKQ